MAGNRTRRGAPDRPIADPNAPETEGADARATVRIVNYPRRDCTGFLRWIPSWKLVFGAMCTVGLVLVGGFAAAVAFTTIPKPNDIASAQRTIVYWNDGETELGRLGEANRISIPLSGMPANLQHAVLAAEDRDYYDHGGFDPSALVRASWNDLSGGATQGASTITQQYAKNAFLTHEQTLIRKARELVLSVKLETEASKDQILEDYLNTIYLGRGAYGVETASQAYFGKSASELNLNQAAAIAAIIRAPGGYDPETHLSKLEARFDYVIAGLLAKGWITSAQAKSAHVPKFAPYRQVKSSLSGTKGYLLMSVQREMLAHGYTEEELNLGGFRIITTFDRNAQQAAVDAVDSNGPGTVKGLRVGLTSVDVKTGEVVAMYGGANYLKNQLSNADQAIALAGSTFKPFALAAAAEDGIKLDSTWDGRSPRTIRGYTLKNEGNASYGQISLLTATEQSVNTVFVDMAGQVGWDKVREAAVRAGIPDKTIGFVADPTTVLGTASPTTEAMAGAYATFANRGKAIQPTVIKEVSRGGTVEYTHVVQERDAFSEDVADYVNFALHRVVTRGTGSAANALGRPAAGKTGTTDNNRSAWFVGYTPGGLATAVMMAKQDKQGNAISLYGTGGGGSVHGGSFPAAIWTAFMRTAMDGKEYKDFHDPPTDFAFNYNQYYYNDQQQYNQQPPAESPATSGGQHPPSGSPSGGGSQSASP